MNFWRYYFSFNGRISRLQFWLKGVPLVVGIYFLVYLIRVIIPIDLYEGILFFIIYPIILLNSWSVFVLMIKRIHDRNKSFWYPLEKYADLPKPNTLDYIVYGFIVFFVLFIYMIVLWIWLFIIEVPFLKGTDGPNNYGPDPLNNEKIQRSESSTLPNHTQ